MKRSFISIFLITALLISLCSSISIPAQAGPIELPLIPGVPTPTVPTGLLYSINNGTVTITGYTGSATELEIPSVIGGRSVTTIADRAFAGCTTLEEVMIPESVTSMGTHVFELCYNLREVWLYCSADAVIWGKSTSYDPDMPVPDVMPDECFCGKLLKLRRNYSLRSDAYLYGYDGRFCQCRLFA